MIELPRFIRQSIGRTQAVSMLLTSLVISLLLSIVQLTYTFRTQHQAAVALSNEVMNLAEGGATTASWTLDDYLAEEVISSVISLGDVQSATLSDESGVLLASAKREQVVYGKATQFVAKNFIRTAVRGQRVLSVQAGGGLKKVGTLSIVLAPEHQALLFLTVANPLILASIFQAIAIGLVLLWLSSRQITIPLRNAALAIAEIDPEHPRANTIVVPPEHADDELGDLLGHTNKMIKRLSSVQDELRTLAIHDPLTGLANRSFVVTRIAQAIERARRNKKRVAVLFIDLDNFKTINDTFGHTRGDELLAQIAQSLLKSLRSSDTAGRVGGDEFLVVIEDIDDALDVAPTVHRIESQFSQPFTVGNKQVDINCSIGIALYPDDGDHASILMRHADMAMYKAKEHKGIQYHFFTQEMSDRTQARLKTEAALRQALALDQFRLAFQPKFDVKGKRLAGCEVLLRWRKEGTLYVAAAFIKLAEQMGIMVEIGYWVIDKACEQAAAWSKEYAPMPIAVNVSAQQLREPDFTDQIFNILKRHELHPSLLELEITETVLIKELSHAGKKLERLRRAGISISIDDFGTGYSSLSYLTHLPANSLKIDRSFVSGSQSSEVVLTMIIAMAKALELTTVAEGIETEEQKADLIARGCDVLQGYLVGMPMSAQAFEKKLLAAQS